MKKLVTVIGLVALGGLGCTTKDEEASLKVFWTFSPTDGCLAGEEIHFGLSPDPFGEDDIFDCMNAELSGRQEGVIGAIPLGSYTVDASVYNNGSPDLSIAPFSFDESFTVDGQEKETTVEFVRGFSSYDVSFRYDFGGSGFTQNCADADSGTTDAGVITQTVDLMNGSQCVAVTVTGTDQTATPFSWPTCGDPQVCNEQDVVHNITDLPPGNYTLTITGNKMSTLGASIACYSSAYTFSTADSTTEAFRLTGPGGADPLSIMFMDTTECNATLQQPIPELPRMAAN
jgi:hypothetical protein